MALECHWVLSPGLVLRNTHTLAQERKKSPPSPSKLTSRGPWAAPLPFAWEKEVRVTITLLYPSSTSQLLPFFVSGLWSLHTALLSVPPGEVGHHPCRACPNLITMASLNGLCPTPFLQESLFPSTGGFTDGRYCETFTNVTCCLPCPLSDWRYADSESLRI